MSEGTFEQMLTRGNGHRALLAIFAALHAFYSVRLEHYLFELGMSLMGTSHGDLRGFILNSLSTADHVPLNKYGREHTWFKALSRKQCAILKQLELVGYPVFVHDNNASELLVKQTSQHALDQHNGDIFSIFDGGLAISLSFRLGGITYTSMKQFYFFNEYTRRLASFVQRFRDWVRASCKDMGRDLPRLSDATEWVAQQGLGDWELPDFRLDVLTPTWTAASATATFALIQVSWTIRSTLLAFPRQLFASNREVIICNDAGAIYGHKDIGGVDLLPRQRTFERSPLYILITVTYTEELLCANPLFNQKEVLDGMKMTLKNLGDKRGRASQIDNHVAWALETVMSIPRGLVRLLVRGLGRKGGQYFRDNLMRRVFLEPALQEIPKIGDMAMWYVKWTTRYSQNDKEERECIEHFRRLEVRSGPWDEDIDRPCLHRAIEGTAAVFGISGTEVALNLTAKSCHFGLPRRIPVKGELVKARRFDVVQSFTLYFFALFAQRQLPPLEHDRHNGFLEGGIKDLCRARVTFPAAPLSTFAKEVEFPGQERVLKDLLNSFARDNQLPVEKDDWSTWRDILFDGEDEHTSVALLLAHRLFTAAVDFFGPTLNLNAWAYNSGYLYIQVDRWRAAQVKASRRYTGERDKISAKEWQEIALILVETGSQVPAKSFLNSELVLLVDHFMPWQTRGSIQAALYSHRKEVRQEWDALKSSLQRRQAVRAGMDESVEYDALILGFKRIREEERKMQSAKAAKKGKGKPDNGDDADVEDM